MSDQTILHACCGDVTRKGSIVFLFFFVCTRVYVLISAFNSVITMAIALSNCIVNAKSLYFIPSCIYFSCVCYYYSFVMT